VDTHTHAPQYINLGIGIDLPLLDWLQTYTFPQEKRFKDLKHAEYVYDKCVKRHLMYGTTTCCYYGTIHYEATKILAQIAEKYGQRAFVMCLLDHHSLLVDWKSLYGSKFTTRLY
jgi:guanine deaminase